MAKREPETLEQGLDRSANKKGLSGKERHRYVGGALRNMEKRGAITLHKRSSRRATAHTPASPRPKRVVEKPPEKAKRLPYEKPTVTKIAPAPKKQAYQRPAMTKREKITLVVKKNTAVSQQRGKVLYSIYKEGNSTPYTTGLFSKRAAAINEAKAEQDAHNYPAGPLKRGRIA